MPPHSYKISWCGDSAQRILCLLRLEPVSSRIEFTLPPRLLDACMKWCLHTQITLICTLISRPVWFVLLLIFNEDSGGAKGADTLDVCAERRAVPNRLSYAPSGVRTTSQDTKLHTEPRLVWPSVEHFPAPQTLSWAYTYISLTSILVSPSHPRSDFQRNVFPWSFPTFIPISLCVTKIILS